MTETMHFDMEIDTSGLRCPLPILRTKKALAQIQSGQVVKVTTTDPNAKGDFDAFTEQTGNVLLAQIDSGETIVHFIRRR